MKRALALITGLLALSGCAGNQPSSSTGATLPPVAISNSPTAAAPPVSPSPTGPIFASNGIGLYKLGADFDNLQSDGKLADTYEGNEVCPEQLGGRGVSPLQDIRVAARGADHRLFLVTSRSASIPTAKGAKIGMTLAEVKSIYGSDGKQLTNGSYKTYLVKGSGNTAIMFDFDLGTGKMFVMIAGDATFLEQGFLNGSDYC